MNGCYAKDATTRTRENEFTRGNSLPNQLHGTGMDRWMDAKEGRNERVPVVRCNDGWMLSKEARNEGMNEWVLSYAKD